MLRRNSLKGIFLNDIKQARDIEIEYNGLSSLEKILYKKTNDNVGNAILTTSLTIAFGFSVLCMSNFIPTILFGIFTALAMIVAMIGVLITLPSIIYKINL